MQLIAVFLLEEIDCEEKFVDVIFASESGRLKLANQFINLS